MVFKMQATLFCLFMSLAIALGSKILVLPNQESSHIRAMAYLGRALAERGHQVTIAITHSQKQGQVVIGKMEQLLCGDPNEKVYYSNSKEISNRFMKYYRDVHVFDNIYFTLFEWPNAGCKALLSDKKLYDTVKARQFDLIIVDGLVITRCNYVFVHSLGVPYISQTAIYPSDIGSVSKFVSFPFTTSVQFLPHTLYMNSDVGKLTFFQRLGRTVILTMNDLTLQYQIGQQFEMYKNYSYDRPLTKSLTQLASESKLWLIEQNPVLEFPRPKYDIFKFVGGMNWAPAKPLQDEYATFTDAATDGFVVVSLGADLSFMPKDLGDKMAAAFLKLPEYKFIWTNKGDLTALPANVMKVGWMPQNDLIGHKNCKLLITHCGNNGQFEAVGHGIPMLGVPIHRDQPANAWRLIDRGFGLTMDLNTVTVDEITDKIREVITNSKYKKNIMKAKAIFHDAPRSPAEEATYWVEHVLKHGGDYLKSDAMDMPWYQVLGYDILAFMHVMIGLLILITIILVKVVKFTCSLVWKGNRKSKSD